MVEHENIELIRDKPKKALLKIAVPMIFALVLISVNNIIDRIWVASLGTEPLAAIGFVAPIFMIIIGLGNGLGTGSNSLISRYIGAKEYQKASNSALHSILIVTVFSIIVPLIILPFYDKIILYMGAGSVLDYTRDYGIPLVLGTFVFLFNILFSCQLRAEGNIKKATISMASVDILNMIMDPFFIYTFKMGVAGAGWATVMSTVFPTLLAIYWLFIKKNTYLNYSFKNFKYKNVYIKGILNVGLPASLEQFIISLVNIIFNTMLVIVAGTNVIAAFNISFTILQLGMMPCIAIGTSAITVAGVAYGAKEYDKVRITCHYGIKISLLIATILTILLVLLAPAISWIFSSSQQNGEFSNLIVHVLRICSLFLIVTPIGGVCGMVFQAMGKGTLSLILTFIREFVFVVILSYLLGIMLNFGLNGILFGFIIGLSIGSLISIILFEKYILKLKNGGMNS